MNQEIKLFAEEMLGHYGWMIITVIIGFLFKESIVSALQGFMVFVGNDFNNDDVIYISGREARIVRVGISKTVFYMTDRGTKMIVPNERLKSLTLEKVLQRRVGHNLPKENTIPEKQNKQMID